MSRRKTSLVAATLAIAIVPAAAQWLNVPTKGIPTNQRRQAGPYCSCTAETGWETRPFGDLADGPERRKVQRRYCS